MGNTFHFLGKMQLTHTFLILAAREKFGFKFLIFHSVQEALYKKLSPFH